MKFRRTNKVGKFEVKKVKNKGAVSKNVVKCRDLSTLPLMHLIDCLRQENYPGLSKKTKDKLP